MPSLNDKLRAMGVRLGSEKKPERQPVKVISLENIISGEYINTEYGEIFTVEEVFRNGYLHGKHEIHRNYDPNRILKWAKITSASEFVKHNAAFIDTETTGLAGGTGTFVFMTGVGFFEGTDFRMVQLCMRDPGEEKAMLARLETILAGKTTIITFNGKAFDIPILKTRYVINHMPEPFGNLKHIDVLQLARRIWKYRLADRSLKVLENEILELERAEEEIPGWLVPQLYSDYLQTQDATPLKGVFYHNKMDVVSLAALFEHLASFLNDPFSIELPDNLDLMALASLYEDFDDYDDAAKLYEICISQGLPEEFAGKSLMRFARIFRRKGEWEKAINSLQKAVERGSFESALELAKLCEHKIRDNEKALFWALQYKEMVQDSNMRKSEKAAIDQETEKRISRLQKKMA